MNARFVTESGDADQTQSSLENRRKVSFNSEEVIFLRLPEVKAITGLSKTSLYSLIREKSFPAPIRLGPRAVAWVRSEVKQWAANCVLASRSAAYLQDAKRMRYAVRRETGASSKKSA
jgi:prophage regulatory protein